MVSDEFEGKLQKAFKDIKSCRTEIAKRIVGQTNLVNGLLMGLLSGGHVLVEGVPGLAKTFAVKTIAEILNSGFKRIQFTPDLLPADLIGNMVYRQQTGEFVPRKGPIFSNIILADEINRAPAKVQSALLEAMEEKQVTISDSTFKLPDPFFVMATQNPIEQEGTYPLPEAELDRFLLKIKVGYPDAKEELEIIRRIGNEKAIPVKKILSSEQIIELKSIVSEIKVDDKIEEYIVALISASRGEGKHSAPYKKYIEYGASPRASIYLYRCAKVQAFFNGRTYVVPDDVKAIVHDVLRHRIILSYEAESEEMKAEDVINQILKSIQVP